MRGEVAQESFVSQKDSSDQCYKSLETK